MISPIPSASTATLTRITVDLYRYADSAHPITYHEHSDHPPLPTARALKRLTARVRSTWAAADEPLTWTHRDHPQWSAITDLHRAGHHDDAVSLAVFMHWCDSWSWDEACHWQLDVADGCAPGNETTASSADQLGQLDLLGSTS